MYVAVKGGEQAIQEAHDYLAQERRGDVSVPELSIAQIREQMSLAVDRVMTEGSLYDPELAALAIKQARGDLVEAVFLLRAFRTTLPRLASSLPVDTSKMSVKRRVSAAFKDLPGGQILGPTFDYTHRLLDFSLLDQRPEPENRRAGEPSEADGQPGGPMPRVLGFLDEEGLMKRPDPDAGDREVGDVTRAPLTLPAGRDIRLQKLARADEGFVMAMGYSTQRGFKEGGHPFSGEIRMGRVAVEIVPEELGFAVEIGEITVTECEMLSLFTGTGKEEPGFVAGYGLTFGHCERKAMSMALVDRALRASELGEEIRNPAQDEEFVLMHSDNVEASGFVEHLKLPHHVDFQGELEILRRLRKDRARMAEREGDDT